MNWNKKIIIMCVMFAFIFALTLGVGPVFAEDPVDDIGLFELDGNAFSVSPTPPEDWNNLYDNGNNTGGLSEIFSGVIPDAGLASIFDGGKKDTQQIDRWSWRAEGGGGFPDKNDITNAYAAAYLYNDPQDGREELIIYFGADRYANTGDAFIGFWFFKDNITANEDGSFGGEHKLGDVLVIVNYPQGTGSQPEIKTAVWDTSVKNNLRVIYDSTENGDNPTCGSEQVEDVCAITNDTEIDSPWPYQPKSGTYKNFPHESFFEGGINITDLVGGDTCFASFMAETRSSKQFTATLKDFVLGSFPLCAVELSKSCSTGTYDPDQDAIVAPYTVTVTNTGIATVESVIATDDSCGYGDPQVFTFGPLAADESATQEGECVIPEPISGLLGTVKNGVSATASVGGSPIPVSLAEACIIGDDPNLCQSQCDITTSPAIETYKKCVTRLVSDDGIKVRVRIAGWVENTSAAAAPVPLKNVIVSDNKAGNLELYDAPLNQTSPAPVLLGTEIRLEPGDKAWFESYYEPTSVNTECPGAANFEDLVTGEGTDVFTGETVYDQAPDDCDLCVEEGCEPLYPLE